jgi:hypothetical protein
VPIFNSPCFSRHKYCRLYTGRLCHQKVSILFHQARNGIDTLLITVRRRLVDDREDSRWRARTCREQGLCTAQASTKHRSLPLFNDTLHCTFFVEFSYVQCILVLLHRKLTWNSAFDLGYTVRCCGVRMVEGLVHKHASGCDTDGS